MHMNRVGALVDVAYSPTFFFPQHDFILTLQTDMGLMFPIYFLSVVLSAGLSLVSAYQVG